MLSFKVLDKEYEMPTSWEEVSLKVFLNIMELESKKELIPIPELYLQRTYEVLCDVEQGEFNKMKMSVVNLITEKVTFMSSLPKLESIKHLKINDLDYVFPNDYNDLTMGEIVSIGTYKYDLVEMYKYIPYVLAILLRPGYLTKDVESGKDIWIQNEFDALNIEHRIDLFMSQPAYKLMGPINFFLNGKN